MPSCSGRKLFILGGGQPSSVMCWVQEIVRGKPGQAVGVFLSLSSTTEDVGLLPIWCLQRWGGDVMLEPCSGYRKLGLGQTVCIASAAAAALVVLWPWFFTIFTFRHFPEEHKQEKGHRDK